MASVLAAAGMGFNASGCPLLRPHPSDQSGQQCRRLLILLSGMLSGLLHRKGATRTVSGWSGFAGASGGGRGRGRAEVEIEQKKTQRMERGRGLSFPPNEETNSFFDTNSFLHTSCVLGRVRSRWPRPSKAVGRSSDIPRRRLQGR